MTQTYHPGSVPIDLRKRSATATAQWLLEPAEDSNSPIYHANQLEVLICGEEGFARILQDIRRAKHSVEIICWGFDPASFDLWPDDRQFNKAAALWTKAAEKEHWKAMLNLASLYVEGKGVTRDTERAVQLVEEAMRKGVPKAFDLMGTYHINGTGVKQDATRAYQKTPVS